MAFGTEQEAFWAGAFGDEYAARNTGAEMLATNLALFGRVLSRAHGVRSVIELGANIGMNLRAIRQLLPKATLAAVEINEHACAKLRDIGNVEVTHGSLFDYRPTAKMDLAFVSGVLIHLAPQRLNDAYDVLASASDRYVLVAEYYNPTPVEVPYRGHSERMYKRDFAGELMDRHSTLQLVDYGFLYRRDPNFACDDLNWFLLEHR